MISYCASTIKYSYSPKTLSLDLLDSKAQVVEWFEVQPELTAEPPLLCSLLEAGRHLCHLYRSKSHTQVSCMLSGKSKKSLSSNLPTIVVEGIRSSSLSFTQ